MRVKYGVVAGLLVLASGCGGRRDEYEASRPGAETSRPPPEQPIQQDPPSPEIGEGCFTTAQSQPPVGGWDEPRIIPGYLESGDPARFEFFDPLPCLDDDRPALAEACEGNYSAAKEQPPKALPPPLPSGEKIDEQGRVLRSYLYRDGLVHTWHLDENGNISEFIESHQDTGAVRIRLRLQYCDSRPSHYVDAQGKVAASFVYDETGRVIHRPLPPRYENLGYDTDGNLRARAWPGAVYYDTNDLAQYFDATGRVLAEWHHWAPEVQSHHRSWSDEATWSEYEYDGASELPSVFRHRRVHNASSAYPLHWSHSTSSRTTSTRYLRDADGRPLLTWSRITGSSEGSSGDGMNSETTSSEYAERIAKSVRYHCRTGDLVEAHEVRLTSGMNGSETRTDERVGWVWSAAERKMYFTSNGARQGTGLHFDCGG